MRETKGAPRDGAVVNDEATLLTVPKNSVTEIRVQRKRIISPKTKEAGNEFLDIRQWWFKDGPMTPPIPTKMGAMIHWEHVPRLSLELMKQLSDKTGLSVAIAQEMVEQANRLLELAQSDV